jgi:murein DD-endopeptidase MepM/ murein hydrolase activator NlpD
MYCAPCWERRAEPLPPPRRDEATGMPSIATGMPSIATGVHAPVRRSARRRWIAAVGVAALVTGATGAIAGLRTPLAGTWQGQIDQRVKPPAPSTATAVALAPLVPAKAIEPIVDPDQGMGEDDGGEHGPRPGTDIPLKDGDPLDERYPTLHDWVHPVTSTSEPVPVKSTRWFGAGRRGVDREECGGGHCGVDLAGPRGQPVVAVAWGVVEHVEHSWMGRDGRSGRYVRIAHPDGVFTAYMHLDDIADGVDVGDEVQAGQMIGTLGKSGIVNAEHHLHFSLEIPGQWGRPLYIDPSPFLHRARVVSVPDRRRPRPPQW